MLHTFYLGPMHVWCKNAIWELLDSDIWGAAEATGSEALIIRLSSLKSELLKWYGDYHELHPTANLSRVSNLTPKMVGASADKRRLKTKAMETFGICLFLVDSLEKYQHFLDKARCETFLNSGKSLLALLQRMKDCDVNPSFSDQQVLVDMYKRFMKMVEPLEMYTPKFHLMYHAVLRIAFQGNPIQYQTFVDESLNKALKRVLRLCHQQAFERMALVKLAEALKRPMLRQRNL
jgi:hypothetical protein